MRALLRQYGIGQLINTISISFRSDACLLDEVVCFNCHADLQIKGRARRVARRAEHDFHHGRILIVRWLDRISRCYDKLHATMRRLMELGVPVEGTPNGMVFDGKAKDPIDKATRVSVLAFMAAQGEADYRNRAEMQRRAVAIAKAAGKYHRPRSNPRLCVDPGMEERGRCEHPRNRREVRGRHRNRQARSRRKPSRQSRPSEPAR